MVLLPPSVYWWVAVLFVDQLVKFSPLSHFHLTCNWEISSKSSVDADAFTWNKSAVEPLVGVTVKDAVGAWFITCTVWVVDPTAPLVSLTSRVIVFEPLDVYWWVAVLFVIQFVKLSLSSHCHRTCNRDKSSKSSDEVEAFTWKIVVAYPLFGETLKEAVGSLFLTVTESTTESVAPFVSLTSNVIIWVPPEEYWWLAVLVVDQLVTLPPSFQRQRTCNWETLSKSSFELEASTWNTVFPVPLLGLTVNEAVGDWL